MIEDSEVIAEEKGNGPGNVTVVSKPSTATKGNVKKEDTNVHMER